MILSILICNIVGREKLLEELLKEIIKQKNTLDPEYSGDIEVLVETDDRVITTGAKRNILLKRAIGDYIVFIDDDDYIAENYLQEIMLALKQKPDCVGMKGWYSVNRGRMVQWKLSKDFTDHDGTDGILYRRTNHISPVKREFALLAGFPDKSNAEDKFYSERLIKYLKLEVFIDEPLYHYDYSTNNKSYL